MDAIRPVPPAPINWDARIGLALATLNWRPRCALTGLLAMKALQGYPIEELMAFERAFKADPESGAA